MNNSERLLRLVAMKVLWPKGPGPAEYKTELHLNDALECVLALYGVVKADVESVMEVVYPPNPDPDLGSGKHPEAAKSVCTLA